MFAGLVILIIVLIGIGLLFKANHLVCLDLVDKARCNQLVEPFDEIPNVEENIRHFLHLQSMGMLVTQGFLYRWKVWVILENLLARFANKQYTKQVYAFEAFEWYDIVEQDYWYLVVKFLSWSPPFK